MTETRPSSLARMLGLLLVAVLVLVLVVACGGEPEDPVAADDDASRVLDRGTPDAEGVVRDMAYGTDSDAQRLDLHLPDAVGPHPVIVWFHGGSWAFGSRTWDEPIWRTFADRYAVVSVGYRFVDEATWPAQGEDALAALDWVQANADRYDLDPDRIVTMGISAGAHLASYAGLATNTPVGGIVSFAGPTVFDFEEVPYTDVDVSPVEELLDCTAETCGDRLDAASPHALARADGPPVYIQHGTDDRIVPLAVAEAFERSLTTAGATPIVEYIDDLGHGYALTDKVTAFVDGALSVG